MNYERKFYSKVKVLLDQGKTKEEVYLITGYDHYTIDKYYNRYMKLPSPKKPNKNTKTIEQKEKEILNSFKAVGTLEGVAKETGYSEKLVRQVLRKNEISIPRKPLTLNEYSSNLRKARIERDEKICNWFDNGIGLTDIGKRLSITKERVRQILSRNGRKANNSNVRLTDKEINTIKLMREDNKMFNEIAEHLNNERLAYFGEGYTPITELTVKLTVSRKKFKTTTQINSELNILSLEGDVIRLRKDGKNIHEISYLLATHQNTVSTILAKHGLNGNSGIRLKEVKRRNPVKIDEDLVNKVKGMIESGKTKRYVVHELKLHTGIVNKILKM